jgi:diguanylate cyclase (GGDEF)-like protein
VVAARTRQLEFANRQLARLATLDGLTGITNRRGFDQQFAEIWDAALADQSSLALLMIDVDHFKHYNDRHGHLAGDHALKSVAQRLAKSIHEREVLARFGGEEFVVLLPGAELGAARARGEELRHDLEAHGEDFEHLTVSVGVAATVPGGGVTPNGLIDAADQALYRAKHAGRNRVEVAV